MKGSGSTATRLRCPPGSTTTKEAGPAAGLEASSGLISAFPDTLLRCARRRLLSLQRQHAHLFHLARTQRLAMSAITAHFGTRQQHLKAEVAFDLLAQPL